MPTIISHTVVAVAAGKTFAPKDVPIHFWLLSIICSIIPDADVIGFYLGVPYGHFFGHRGFFHSPFFGLLLSIFIVGIFFNNETIFSKPRLFYFIFFFLLSASQGIFDAFTNGGLGIALLSPFANTRYFFPWTPIIVSPLGVKGLLSNWGLMVIISEIFWIWLPSLLIVVIAILTRMMSIKGHVN
ncbi:MAG: metal-dependent hydrolase [Desulfobacterales bacterium]|nr:MAG: metal-dependent hydrolase [Desulfobacterales bacterium]